MHHENTDPFKARWLMVGNTYAELVTPRLVLHSCQGEPARTLGEGSPDCEIHTVRDKNDKPSMRFKCTRCGAVFDV